MVGVAWRPFNWSHPRGLANGAPAERHGCLFGFGRVICLVCLVPGTGFAHVDLGRDPPGLFLACNRGGLHSFVVGQDVRGDWLAFLESADCRGSDTWRGQIAGPEMAGRKLSCDAALTWLL